MAGHLPKDEIKGNDMSLAKALIPDPRPKPSPSPRTVPNRRALFFRKALTSSQSIRNNQKPFRAKFAER